MLSSAEKQLFKAGARNGLGAAAATSGATAERTAAVTGKVRGHRVLQVQTTGPAAKAGLTPYLDIITHVAGVQLDDQANTLAKLVVPWIEQDVDVTVFNVRTRQARIVMLNPNRSWGGPGVLGLVAR